MKAESVGDLHFSVNTGLWATTGTVSRMLQQNWEMQKGRAKIGLIFVLSDA